VYQNKNCHSGIKKATVSSKMAILYADQQYTLEEL